MFPDNQPVNWKQLNDKAQHHRRLLEKPKMDNQAKQSKKDLNGIRRRSYLLRLWSADQPGSFNWQASLEDPETGERIGFASLEELFAYLMDLTMTNELKEK